MMARGPGIPVFGLALVIAFGLSAARAEEVALDLPLPAEAGPVVIELSEADQGPSVPTTGAIASTAAGEPVAEVTATETAAASEPATVAETETLALPEQPEVVVEVPPAETVPAQPEPVRAAEIDPPLPDPAPVALTASDMLPGAIELRATDPKLPLPPKLARKDREALASAYAARRFRQIWIADGAWNGPAKLVIERLGRAAEDGLDPADYPVPSLAAGSAPLTASELAEAEMKLSAAAFLYARDARGGRLEPWRISGLITPKLSVPALPGVLAELAETPDPGAALLAYNPIYPGYLALRTKLAEIRAGRPATAAAPVPARSGLTRQAALGQNVQGGVGQPRLEGDIVANMERWRWLPAELAPRYVAVNIPEFRVRLLSGGHTLHEARVITGAAKTPTPIFSGLIQYAVVNPSWYVPPSIIRQHPGLASDPTYASRAGLTAVRAGRTVVYRQPPGPNNALGYIKFMFPNDHAVYLHDTPHRSLFAAGVRAYSHGCVRVENPFAFGGAIMGGNWTEGRLKSLIGHGETAINLAEKLPVHLVYFTISVDETGAVRTFDDVYGYNRRVRAALGLGA